MKFLIYLAQIHEDFRLAELEALADMHELKDVKFGPYCPESPFLTVDLDSSQSAQRLIERSILSKSIYELYGQGEDLDDLHENLRKTAVSVNESQPQKWPWNDYAQSSFKFEVESYLGSRPRKHKIQMIESFAYMGLEGPIQMKNPEQQFHILEDYKQIGDKEPKQMYFGRLVGQSARASGLVDKYDLKKRPYIGTTSFDAELALVTCNIAQVDFGCLVYDPFVGTGSFIVAAGHYGAACIGSDIDVRMIKGKEVQTGSTVGRSDKTNKKASFSKEDSNNSQQQQPEQQQLEHVDIETNFRHYDTATYLVDAMAIDFTHDCFRSSLKFDAVLCDPPYGVREGLRVLGSRDPERHAERTNVVIDGELAHLRRDYVPPKKPYDFNSLLNDLLSFGSRQLAENKRLCFWMPTATEDNFNPPTDIPSHEDLEFVCACEQEFNKWSRRLIVYKRLPYGQKGSTTTTKLAQANEEFRDKYFRGFRQKKQQA